MHRRVTGPLRTPVQTRAGTRLRLGRQDDRRISRSQVSAANDQHLLQGGARLRNPSSLNGTFEWARLPRERNASIHQAAVVSIRRAVHYFNYQLDNVSAGRVEMSRFASGQGWPVSWLGEILRPPHRTHRFPYQPNRCRRLALRYSRCAARRSWPRCRRGSAIGHSAQTDLDYRRRAGSARDVTGAAGPGGLRDRRRCRIDRASPFRILERLPAGQCTTLERRLAVSCGRFTPVVALLRAACPSGSAGRTPRRSGCIRARAPAACQCADR